jgi:hypothetical protein
MPQSRTKEPASRRNTFKRYYDIMSFTQLSACIKVRILREMRVLQDFGSELTIMLKARGIRCRGSTSCRGR